MPDRYQVDRELIFTGSDLLRPRMAVEQEKLRARFPGFKMYAVRNQPSSVKGYLSTSYGGYYYVSIELSEDYPYEPPTVILPYNTIHSDVHHKFSEHKPCVMSADQWSSSLSLAFIVAKTAIWLNKYDYWKRSGRYRWPGAEQ